ncbi:MAG: cytochrome c family protein [Hyphomicrobiales bacterium]|nr:cytochrome c family protein [Hyphomicrobiales bacterium]
MNAPKWLFSLAAAVMMVMPAVAGDAALGQKVFNKCKACHEASDVKNKVGPGLKGLFGRKAGSVEGYAYSEAMKNSGITWDEDTLKAYLADPKAIVPGGKMSFAGLKKEEELENIIEYLEQATK